MAESATQQFLEIQDIREGVLLLKNKSIRGVLMVSSINFALKSEDEQTAVIYAFQSFLNSLDFSCQIVIQSRNINITPYLDGLKDLEDRQPNELLREQTASYRVYKKHGFRRHGYDKEFLRRGSLHFDRSAGHESRRAAI